MTKKQKTVYEKKETIHIEVPSSLLTLGRVEASFTLLSFYRNLAGCANMHCDSLGDGQVITVRSGATLNLSNGTLKGGWGGHAGGLSNESGTANLTNVNITGNKARTVGGGIWSGNEKHLLKMQGANIITDNTAAGVSSNLFMLERRWITLTGSITGSRIGVMLDVAPNQFTDGYATYHSGEDPNTFFTLDKPWVDSLAIIQPEPYVLYVGEVIMRRKNLKGKVPYIEHSWDSENQKVVSTVKILTEEIGLNDTPTSETQYKKLKSSDLYVDLGTKGSELHEYYVVEGDELNIYALDVEGPNVHIILRDSAYLHLDHDIGVEKGNTVYFHAQSTGSYIGKLTAGDGKVSFKGIYDPKAIAGEDKTILYMGSGNKLYYPNQAMTINSCRAYFSLEGISAGDLPTEAVYLNFGEGTTGVNGVRSKMSEVRSDVFFDLSGQRVVTPKKGLYITNGKKVVLK